MTRSQSIAYRMRWGILLLGLCSVAAGVGWVLFPAGGENWDWFPGDGLWGTPVYIDELQDDQINRAYYVAGAVFLGLFLLTQGLFLFPRGRLRLGLTDRGRPMILSVLGAAFAAMLLSTAAAFTLVETIILITGHDGVTWDVIAQLFGDDPKPTLHAVWAAMAVLWSVWGFIFYHYWHAADRYTWLSQMTRRLLAGSILEMLAAAPVHALALRRESCYCSLGTYTGLVFGGTVALWCFGPGIVLLFLREKHRRHPLIAPS
jgi:hypothetical protein